MSFLKTQYAVSVQPKYYLDNSNGGYQAHEEIHENVRRSLSGDGQINGADGVATVSGGWDNGNNTKYTSANTVLTGTTSTDMLFIKHTGFLFNTTTKCDSADTMKISINVASCPSISGTNFELCELGPGEAMVFPRPSSSWGIITSSVGEDVSVEILKVGA